MPHCQRSGTCEDHHNDEEGDHLGEELGEIHRVGHIEGDIVDLQNGYSVKMTLLTFREARLRMYLQSGERSHYNIWLG